MKKINPEHLSSVISVQGFLHIKVLGSKYFCLYVRFSDFGLPAI